MSNADSFNQYAADCMRLAEREVSPEAKTVMFNMAVCWVRLAEQKQALAAALTPELRSLEPAILEEAIESPPRKH